MTPRALEAKNARYLRRLQGIAEVILLTPWLREIRIAVQFEDDMSWETWDIVYVPGERICLCPRYDPEWFEPEICCELSFFNIWVMLRE